MSLLSDIWHEFQHILGIATAIAPIVAISDPAAALSIERAQAAVAGVTPILNAINNASSVPLTDQQKTDMTVKAITIGANIAAEHGKISQQSAAMVSALIPAVQAAVAANKDVPTPQSTPAV